MPIYFSWWKYALLNDKPIIFSLHDFTDIFIPYILMSNQKDQVVCVDILGSTIGNAGQVPAPFCACFFCFGSNYTLMMHLLQVLQM